MKGTLTAVGLVMVCALTCGQETCGDLNLLLPIYPYYITKFCGVWYQQFGPNLGDNPVLNFIFGATRCISQCYKSNSNNTLTIRATMLDSEGKEILTDSFAEEKYPGQNRGVSIVTIHPSNATVTSNYNTLYVDKNYERFSIICTCFTYQGTTYGTLCWVLSKAQKPDKDTMREISVEMKRIESAGGPKQSAFIRTPQDKCKPNACNGLVPLCF